MGMECSERFSVIRISHLADRQVFDVLVLRSGCP